MSLAELDAFMAARGYDNRSEAIRDLARRGLREASGAGGQKRDCVAALVYVYDHAARQLSKRLTRAFHDHHELSHASLHVHLDQESCLEVTVLKGKSADVQAFADHVIAERGVRHGKIVRMPVDLTLRRTAICTAMTASIIIAARAAQKPALRPKRARKARG